MLTEIFTQALCAEAPAAIYCSSVNSKATARDQPVEGSDNGPSESPLTKLLPSEVAVTKDRAKTKDLRQIAVGPPGSNGSNRSNAAPSRPSSQSELAYMVTHPAESPQGETLIGLPGLPWL